MNGSALILAAHGSQHELVTAALVREHARRIQSTRRFDEVAVAFHQGRPGFSEVLDQLTSSEITIVPLMTSRGYYSEKVLPWSMSQNRRYAHVQIRQTAPVGIHARLAQLVVERVRSVLDHHQIDPKEAELLLIGHGTPKHAQSRRATEILAAGIRTMDLFAAVAEAFLDEQPSVAEAFALRQAMNVIVVPFLIGQGAHVCADIPMRLGMSLSDPPRLPLRQQIDGRLVICDVAVGTYSGLTELIVDLAFHPSKGDGPNRSARPLRLGTRASLLARWQANLVAHLLQARGVEVEIVTLSTPGDRDHNRPIIDLPGRAPFTDEIEEALLDKRIDLAVHSLKDLPLNSADGLTLAAILSRGPVTESLISRSNMSLDELPPGATVGTSSPRRVAQLLALRPDLRPESLRGAVDDRVRQIREGRLDAAILATAGLQRLGLLHEVSQTFSLNEFLPAPAQGAVAIQVREDDIAVRETCAGFDDQASRTAVTAEREFLRPFDSDPDLQVAAFAEVNGDIELRARLISTDGRHIVEVSASGSDPRSIAQHAIELAMQHIRNPEFDRRANRVTTVAEQG